MQGDIHAVVEFHGHLCMGLAIGYRVAKAGMKRINALRSEDEELVAIVENNSCAVDAVQYITGCTFGKGNLIFKDYGKNVYTFALRPHGKGVRISLKANVFQDDQNKDEQNNIDRILNMNENELFDIKEVRIELPPEAKIHKSIPCMRCGEAVMETRLKKVEDKLYCIPCYNELNAKTEK